MDDRRQLTRKEPLEVHVPSLELTLKVAPLPWRKRGDLGNLIQKQFSKALDAAKESGDDPYALIDYNAIVAVGAGLASEQGELLTYEEMIQLVRIALDLNGLDQLLWMLDPEAVAPTDSTENGARPEDGEKTSSTDDSS